MVRAVLLSLILLYGCISLKSDKQWNNSLEEAIDVRLIIPDTACVGDTVVVGVELHNVTSEQIGFYEPVCIALIEKVNDFRHGMMITLEEKQLSDVSTIFELKEYDSIILNYKFKWDSTEYRKSAEIPLKVILLSMPPSKKSNCPSFIKKGSIKSPVKTINIK